MCGLESSEAGRLEAAEQLSQLYPQATSLYNRLTEEISEAMTIAIGRGNSGAIDRE